MATKDEAGDLRVIVHADIVYHCGNLFLFTVFYYCCGCSMFSALWLIRIFTKNIQKRMPNISEHQFKYSRKNRHSAIRR